MKPTNSVRGKLKPAVWIPALLLSLAAGAVAQTAAPEPLIVTRAGSSTIALQWIDRYDNETGFQIERGLAGQNYDPMYTTSPGETNFEDHYVQALTTYYYRVRAMVPTDDGAYAYVSGTTTPAAAPDPLVV